MEKYLLLKPKRSNLTERPSMCAFNLELNLCVFAVVCKPFCEEAENAFSHPNASISQIAVTLSLKHKTNVSFRLLFWVFAQLRELNPPSESESEKHGSSRSLVSLYPGEWVQTRYFSKPRLLPFTPAYQNTKRTYPSDCPAGCSLT